MRVLLGASIGKLFGLEFTWWGWPQSHKWRWHRTHIDLGMLSVYGIKRPWMWLPLAWAIKPMRMYYHYRYAGPWQRNVQTSPNFWGHRK